MGVDRKHQVGMYSIMLKRRRREELFCAPGVAAMLQALIGLDRKHQTGMCSITVKRRRRKKVVFFAYPGWLPCCMQTQKGVDRKRQVGM